MHHLEAVHVRERIGDLCGYVPAEVYRRVRFGLEPVVEVPVCPAEHHTGAHRPGVRSVELNDVAVRVPVEVSERKNLTENDLLVVQVVVRAELARFDHDLCQAVQRRLVHTPHAF